MNSELISERIGSPDLAVLIPCFNEAVALPSVIADFRDAFPDATIYVYDNNSSDGSAEVARRCGAQVRQETQQGKGNVVRRMFADVDADVYLAPCRAGKAASARDVPTTMRQPGKTRPPAAARHHRPGRRLQCPEAR